MKPNIIPPLFLFIRSLLKYPYTFISSSPNLNQVIEVGKG